MSHGPPQRAWRKAGARWLLAATIALVVDPGPGIALEVPPFWQVARVSGDALGCLGGHAEREIALLACGDICLPIPWQLDERDAAGDFALPDGPHPNLDEPPGVLDGNDEVLWMAADGGRRIRADEVPAAASCGLEIVQRSGAATRWVYAFVLPSPAPRSPTRYVDYDPIGDTITSARVAIGFGAPTPRYLALRHTDGALGPNLLDRLKVRASARFFGIIPLGRDEDDIQWIFGAWHAGPIRVVRREWQWVRLGWGLRTPVFRTETLIYRDSIELPVRLRLNFPPTYFFAGIEVSAALDFRDLTGWSVRSLNGPAGLVGELPDELRAGVNVFDGDWLALAGPDITLILHLEVGESFASLRRQIFFREDDGAGPETVPGEHPAIGFRLTEWGAVRSGDHWFAAIAYALPPTISPEEFARDHAESLTIETQALALGPR